MKTRTPLLARKFERALWSVYLTLKKRGQIDNVLAEKFRSVNVGETTVIEALRIQSGISCHGLAKRLNLSDSLLYKIEKRTRPAPIKAANALMQFFARDLEDLFGEDGRALTLADSEEFCEGQLNLEVPCGKS